MASLHFQEVQRRVEANPQVAPQDRLAVPLELVQLSERPVELALVSMIFESQHLIPLHQHAVFAAVSRHIASEDTYFLHHLLREQDGISSEQYTALICGSSDDPALVAIWHMVRTSLECRTIPDQLERYALHQLGVAPQAIDEAMGLITVAQMCIDLGVSEETIEISAGFCSRESRS